MDELKLKLGEARSKESVSGRLNLAARAFEGHSSEEKKRRRSKKKSKDSTSSSDEDGPSKKSKALFREGLPRGVSLKDFADQQSGALYEAGLQEITQYLGQRGGPSKDSDAASVIQYLVSVFQQHYSPDKVGQRTAREMRTIAEALDSLKVGNLPRVADLLMQRFKSLEMSVIDGSWGTASKMELLPARAIGLASAAEQTQAAKEELLGLRLEAAKRGRGS